MYKKIPSLLFTLLIAATTFVHAQDADPNMGIIPVPVSVKKSIGEFILSQETKNTGRYAQQQSRCLLLQFFG
jgi:hexosaminidase